MEEGNSDAGSRAQPALQLPLSARGWITDLWTPRSLWVSCNTQHRPVLRHHSMQKQYRKCCSVYLPQMFCDLTTLTASSKLKESALLLRSCSLTTCSPQRQMGHPKTLCKLRATANHNQDDTTCHFHVVRAVMFSCHAWAHPERLDMDRNHNMLPKD